MGSPRDRRRMMIVQQEHQRLLHERGEHWDNKELRDRVAQRYRDDPDLMDPDRVASLDVDRFDRARRPDPSAPSFFDEDAWVPLGEGKRVQMGAANNQDVRSWQVVLTREHANHVSAYLRSTEYIASRLDAWRDEDRTLGDVERRLYGDGDDE